MWIHKNEDHKKVSLPQISLEKRIEIAINCAVLSEYDDDDFITWALHWVDGSNRSEAAAAEAASCTADATANFNLSELLNELCG
jgi:hypothetical protein